VRKILDTNLKGDPTQNDHLVIAVHLFEGFLKYLLGVLPISRKILPVGANQASWSFPQAVPVGIFAYPT